MPSDPSSDPSTPVPRQLHTGEERLRLLADASRMLAESSLQLAATLEALAQIVVPRLADDCVVFVIDEDGTIRRVSERSVVPAHAAVLRKLRANPPKLGGSNSVLSAVRSGQTVYVPHVDERMLANLAGSTEHAAALRSVAPSTFVTVPLFGRGQVLGAFTFGMSVSGRTYTPEDVELAEELGRRAGMAIENARLLRDAVDARRRAEHAELRTARLQGTTAALLRVKTMAEAGAAVLEHGLSLFGAHAGIVYIKQGHELQPFASLRNEGDVPCAYPLAADTPSTWSARTGEHLFLDGRAAIVERFPAFDPVLTADTQAGMVLALNVESEVIGVIALSFGQLRTFSDEERQFAAAIASQCALAIDRAMLMQRERAAAERAAFLDEASELLASSLDRDRVLDELVSLVVPRFADCCAVELVEGDTTRQLAIAHVDPEKATWAARLREDYPPPRTHPRGLHQVLRTGKPELYPRVPDDLLEADAHDATHLALLRQLEMRSLVIVPLLASGTPLGAMTVVWSGSDRHYTTSDLELFVELAHRAALAVENAALVRELQQAVRVRDDFLAAAGHELKTPLAALLMHVESLQRQLRRDVVPSNLAQRLDKAASAGTRLERLIDELLDVSRITAGRLDLEAERVPLDELVRDVVERFVEQAASAGCSIAVHTEPVTGTWDRSRIDQVISNLVGNALKYGRGTPVEIEVEASGDAAVFRITDHGIGVATAEQARIFERFERAVENRNFGGFGLGLWIARQIVEVSAG
ncbi:MAG: GAF domain-containing protein, partial [Deltaproteobacteria bacterium]|nr:GAF domain-containing protein [Deltaproteobacteria bacterium]